MDMGSRGLGWGLEPVPEWVHFGGHIWGPKMGYFGVLTRRSSNLGHISGLNRFGPVLYGIIHFVI